MQRSNPKRFPVSAENGTGLLDADHAMRPEHLAIHIRRAYLERVSADGQVCRESSYPQVG